MNTTIHMQQLKSKPFDVHSSKYIDFGVIINNKDPTFKVGDHVKILR